MAWVGGVKEALHVFPVVPIDSFFPRGWVTHRHDAVGDVRKIKVKVTIFVAVGRGMGKEEKNKKNKIK